VAAHVLANRFLHHEVINVNGPEAITTAEFVRIGNEVTGNTLEYEAISDEQMYEVFDAMGVPRTTDGDFLDGSPAPFSSEGMVTFGEAIRRGEMSLCSDDVRQILGRRGVSVREAFENADDYLIGDRNAVDDGDARAAHRPTVAAGPRMAWTSRRPMHLAPDSTRYRRRARPVVIPASRTRAGTRPHRSAPW